MRIKQFIGYALVYLLVVGIIVFVENSGSYRFKLLDINVEYPIFVWVLAPLVIFVVLTILHMLCANFSIFRERKAIKNDCEVFKNSAKEAILGIENNREFKTEYFKDAIELTKTLAPFSGSTQNLDNEDLQETLNIINSIKNGEIVDIKKFKLSKDNEIYLLNEANKLAKDPQYAFEILRKSDEFGQDLSLKAKNSVLKNATFADIKRVAMPQNKEETMIIIDRFFSDDKFEMTREDFLELIKNTDFSENEYIKLFRMLKNKYTPDVLLSMFEKLKNEKSEAHEAYLYALYELGMIDELRDQMYFGDGEKNEKFEILLFLRDNGKSIPASYLFC